MTDYSIPVPQEELDAKPNFLMTAGWYETTLQPGAEVVKNDAGTWAGIRIPFAGFTSKKDGKTYDKDRRFQITTENPSSPKAEQIGYQQLVATAAAFGLTEDVDMGGGKMGKRPTFANPEEFAEQLNALAGTPCDVYVTVKTRKRDGKPVLRDDGQGPVKDNEISRVAALGTGK